MASSASNIDQWSPFSHKQALNPDESSAKILAPSWVPAAARRRITAYLLCDSYVRNVARDWLRETDRTERLKNREYGDADLLVERIVAGVLGDAVQIVVDGADVELSDEPDLGPEPETAEGATGISAEVVAAVRRTWEANARLAIERWEQAHATVPGLRQRQDWLRDWAESEGYVAKVYECETGSIVACGDGVHVYGWSAAKGRPTLTIYPPHAFFPVDDEYGEGDFASKVHLAWEFTDADGRKFLRRITWELGPILPARDTDGIPVLDDDGMATLIEGDRRDDEGGIYRIYPWADDRSYETCYLSDGTWEWNDLGPRGVNDLDDSRAVWARNADGQLIRDLDLRVDFIPVVHIPNTPASVDGFGTSALARVAQLLDDLAASDTEVQSASAIAGTPMLGVAGRKALGGTISITPGAAIDLGEGGRLDVVDLTHAVEVLQALVGALLKRLSVNAQVPEGVLGRVDASEVPSGVALALSFSPFTQLVSVLRLTRAAKYALGLKMVQRLAQAGGALEPGPNPAARLAFGSFLPTDTAGVVETVVALLQAHGVSRRTALGLLVDAGIEIGDLSDELAAIEREDTEAAVRVADATGSEQAAADRLGIELPETQGGPTPTITLPQPEGEGQ